MELNLTAVPVKTEVSMKNDIKVQEKWVSLQSAYY